MSWLPPDVEYRIEVLSKERENALAQIPVFELGIIEESKELEMHWLCKQQLIEAINFLRGTTEAIVSLTEYKQILADLILLSEVINHKETAITRLQGAIEKKNKEIKLMEDHVDRLRMVNRLGVVLRFRTKDERSKR